ncbi:putative lipoprotein [Myxococcus xanthus DK 1622]|uniref:Lipoprotein n=1 Tax=Myxococcus xanthus (strain DK1622) TaxID=246197 RepID=Q1CZ91_MYXXD|nr:lipoprotein [Myxococcus xanthus]ABF91137.1 putative lipoprotein [Myxococcus xanthus DK 1622]QZZ53783.1 hypothetical protein MyxoNM_31635 [Myxococcus xanthus]SDY12169.1 ELWxxDGT repeat-containing protein [Myxococcus xanthus]
MRARSGCALVWLGLAGCGGLPGETVEAREVAAQACPAGVASRVKVVVPPGSGSSVNGPYPESLVDVQGQLYFATNFFDGSAVLWRSNGTEAGTTWVKKLDAQAVPIGQTGFAGNLGLFLLRDGPNTEVWKTDGTSGGTVRLETFGKFVNLLGALNTSVYLYSMNPSTKRLRIESVSLGGGGKTSVTTLPNPYSDQEDAYPSVQRTATSGGKLYFSVAIGTSGPAPREVSLWALNGAAGTVQLSRALSTGDEYASPLFPTGTGPVLFVASKSGSGIEPWFTQGSPATTGQLAEIRPGAGSSVPDAFTLLGNRIYFRAVDDTNSFQLWSMPAAFSCPAGLAEAE